MHIHKHEYIYSYESKYVLTKKTENKQFGTQQKKT